MKQNIRPFILTQKQKRSIMKAALMMHLNQFTIRLYQTYKNILEQVRAGLLIKSSVTLLIFQNTIPQPVTVISNYQKELDHPRKALINIQNISDNECLNWCLVRNLHPTDHNPRRIKMDDKLYGDNLGFKDIKFPVKVRDTHKIERKNSHRHQCFWLQR